MASYKILRVLDINYTPLEVINLSPCISPACGTSYPNSCLSANVTWYVRKVHR